MNPSHKWSRPLETIAQFFKAVSMGEPWAVLREAVRGHINPMPESAKRATLRHVARQNSLRLFVETGTFRGETLKYLEPDMEVLHSIELSTDFYVQAKKEFSGHKKIHLHQGDSAEILPQILAEISQPALFWLDAHFSGKDTAMGSEETPIIKELTAVFSQGQCGHCILIDDAGDFSSNPAYPDLHEIKTLAEKAGYSYECRFNLIRLLPCKQND